MKKQISALLLFFILLFIACIPDYDNSIDTENDNSVPPPPQELKLTAISLQAKVNGTFVYDYVNAKGIVFERRLKAIGEFTPVDTFETADSVETFTDSTSLDYSTVYEYRLFAYNDNGISTYLDTSEITTGIAPDIIAPVIEMLYPLTDSLTVGVSEITVSFSLTDLSIIGGVTVNDSTTIYDSTEARYNYLLTLSEGKNSFTILAKDEFENASTKTFLEIYYEPTLLDEAAPLLSDYKANARSFEDSIVVETIGTSITLSGMVTDASGIASVIVNDSLAAISNNNWNITVEIGKDSYKEVTVTATDASINGNSTTNTLYILNEIDSIAPTVSIISHKDSAIVTNSTIILSGKIFDNSGISTMSYRGTEAVITDSIWTLEVKDITESSFDKIVVQTRDNSLSQNLSKDTIHIMYDPTMLDSVAPVITVESHNKIDTVETASVTISGTVMDASSTVSYLKINGVDADRNGVSWSYYISELDKNSNNEVIIETADNSTNGNVSKDTITLFYNFDNQKPIISVTAPIDSHYVTTNNVTVEGSATDVSGIKSILVNSSPVTVTDGNFETVKTVDAYDTWMKMEVVAIDNSPQANRDTVTRWVRWDSTYEDNTKPTLTVISHDIDGTAKTGDESIIISGIAFDENGINEVRVNGVLASYETTDSIWTVANVAITNGDGVETPIVVVAIDKSAHANKDTLEFNIVFEDDLIGNEDVAGPDINIFHNSNPLIWYKTINTDNANLVGSVNDPSGISEFKVSINGGAETDITLSGSSWSESFTFTKYTNEMVFRAKDVAENWTVETVIIYCDMNNPAPHLEYDLVGNTISWNWSKESGIDFDRYLIWTSTNSEPITGSAPSYTNTGMTDTTHSYTIDLAEDNWLVVAMVDSAQDTIFSQMKNCAQGLPDGMVLISSKGETFEMGDDYSTYSSPVHQVGFTYNYYMDTTEVTQEKYHELMSAHYPSVYRRPSWQSAYGLGVNYPAYYVSWYTAALYCNAKSKIAGLDTVYLYTDITTSGSYVSYAVFLENITVNYDARGFRLPTEAEWEFACRAETTTDFYWGRDFSYTETASDTVEANKHAVWTANSSDYGPGAPEYGAHEVASKDPNDFGLYDMSGNTSEWCNDWYVENYDNAASSDPQGPATGVRRAKRGGTWQANLASLQMSLRVSGSSPQTGSYTSGFRPVLPVEIPVDWQTP